MNYRLWYWSGIPGRGEFIRLPLEAAGIDYEDCARIGEGDTKLLAEMERLRGRGPFAPPFLEIDGLVLAQVPNILLYLGDRHGLAPSNIADRYWMNQVQLTIADVVTEVHNIHHPVDPGAFYDDQKAEAARAAAQFRANRLPKFLRWFEGAITANEGPFVIDHRWSYADTSLFQLVEGLRYMFPRRMAVLENDCPALIGIRNNVAELPGIASYLASERRAPFSEKGIFRYYPELDGE